LETHDGWSPVVPDLKREKLKLQIYQAQQQRKVRLDERGKGRKQKKKLPTNALGTFPSKPSTFKKRVRKLVSEVK